MMGAHQQIGIAPSPAVMAILSRFDRPTLEAFLTVALDLLDTLDPDPDLEETGDEQDGSFAEDEECAQHAQSGSGAGCTISDPDTGVEDGPKGFDPEEDMCLAGDHGCGPVVLHGSLHWGSVWEGEADLAAMPKYGIDQTKGPLPPF